MMVNTILTKKEFKVFQKYEKGKIAEKSDYAILDKNRTIGLVNFPKLSVMSGSFAELTPAGKAALRQDRIAKNHFRRWLQKMGSHI